MVADSVPLENQDRSILMPDSNLSNFSTDVIYDMQVLELSSALTATQQIMDFLNNSQDNMAQNEDMVDSIGNTNQQFQLMVPKKKEE
jgi:hypothetical protein